jgi:outer membrane lipoprotein-sorting protein
MSRLILLTTALLLVLTPFPAFAEDPPLPSLDEVTQRLDDLYRSKSSKAKMKMIIENDRGKRTLVMDQWSLGEEEFLVVIRSPARERGTATLKTEEGLWNYAPRADRLIRVPSGLLSESWMGSNFSNDDLVRDSSYADDFESELEWIREAGERHLKLTLKPKPKTPVVYDRIVFVMKPDVWTPVRADYFDKGKLMRRMTFSDIKTVDGRPVPMRMELKPMNKKNERTVVVYEELEFDVDVSKKLFTKQGLRRVARKR